MAPQRHVRRGRSLLPTCGVLIVTVALSATRAPAQTNETIQSPSELKKLSLDELFAMEVTSVSKKPEKLSETAAAIHVVTDEDISRTGALSIPEALRDIPGVEVEATYQLLPAWRLNAGYTFFDLHLHTKPGSTDTTQESQEGDSPRQQAFLKSWIDLPHQVQVDCAVRFVDELPNQQVPGYVAFDVHLGWQLTKNLELSIVGANLLDPQHPEFGMPGARTEVPRSIYGKVTCRF